MLLTVKTVKDDDIMKFSRKEIDELIITTKVYEYDNEYARERIMQISLNTFRKSGVPGSKTYLYDILKTLREEWIIEMKTICNPFVLFTISKRIKKFRDVLK